MDKQVQAPTILTNAGVHCTLIGKVADIVANDGGESISCVPTEEVMRLTVQAVKNMEKGFVCTNVQETDLAGHSQSAVAYREILETADRGIGAVLKEMEAEDILVVMADHGNDPNIGHSRHTRECVPLLIYTRGMSGREIGTRKTLSDVGASVCSFFGVKSTQNGTSFLEDLR